MYKKYIDADGNAHTESLEDYQQRMLIELWDLSFRLEKLKKFLNSRSKVKELDIEIVMLMAKQQQAMANYAECLFNRFKLEDVDPTDFKPEDVKELAEKLAKESVEEPLQN